MSSPRRTAMVLAVLAAAALVLPIGAAAASPMPPAPAGAVPEPLPAYQGQDECSATAKPGVVSFKNLLLSRYPGSRNLGIVRACHLGSRSEHKEGRAFDWGVRVDRPTEAGYARDLITWLLATDADGVRYANARRLGVMYMIWNRRIWSSTRAAEGWRAYTGPNPHTDHVHFSFTWPAAYRLTSYWTGKAYGTGSVGGAIDRTFGTDGWTALSRSRQVRLVTQLQRDDGSMLAVGQTQPGTELVLAGVTAEGKPAPAYGGATRIRLPLPEGTVLRAATLLPSGGVVAAGTVPAAAVADPQAPGSRDAVLVRITTKGVLYTGFGTGGVAVIDFGGDDDARAVTSAADGTLLVTGSSLADGVSALAVARSLSNGQPDPAFGASGVARHTARGAAAGTAIRALPDGRSLVGCQTGTNRACLLRLTATGAPDGGFGIEGTVVHPALRTVAAMSPAAGGKLYVTGHAATGARAAVLRLKESGVRDTSFGKYGVTMAGLEGCVAEPTGVVVRWDGSPVISGRFTDCPTGGFVGRFLPDGSLDARWGTNGVAVVGGEHTSPGALLQQSNGRIVLPATAGLAPDTDMTGTAFTTVGPVQGLLGVSRSAATTIYGSRVTITAKARSTADNRGVAGVPVIFYARRDGVATWTKLGVANTDSGGRARFGHAPHAATSYRTSSIKNVRLFATQSGRVGVAVRPRVGVPVTSVVVSRGTPMVLSVTVRPGGVGRPVRLQRVVGGKWVTIATRSLSETGTARLRVVRAVATTRDYRWVMPAEGGRLTGWSRTVRVQWR